MRSLTGLAIISEPSEVSDQSGAFPALSCESFHVLPVKIITKNKKKRLIKVEVGPGCGPAGATVGPLLTLLKLLTGFLS